MLTTSLGWVPFDRTLPYSHPMILEQFYLGCLAHASYIIIDERTKTAAIIDPQRDIEQYLQKAEDHGAKVKYVLLTHFHADFVAGHLELRNLTGARIYLGNRADAEYDFTRLKDDDVLEFGDVRLKIFETPGHTPEGISVVAYDLAQSDTDPVAVFTGDTLFVGDVGRPDLMASIGITADELAGMLFDSLHNKLMTLPDETIVYPAHGAGSMCGKNLGSETFSTIGTQRRVNYALQPMSKERFIEVVTAEQPKAPAYFGYDAAMNKKERATLDQTLERILRPLSLDEFLDRANNGAQLVDVRDSADFAGAHLKGSLNIGLDGKFATWSGSLLSHAKDILIVAEPGHEREAAVRLGRIGFDRVVGYLKQGMEALAGRPDLIASNERITAKEVSLRLGDSPDIAVIDIRAPGEYAGGHIEGSINIPLQTLRERYDELPSDREFALVCRTGYRSSTASSLLLARGVTNFVDLVGGMVAWKASELPIVEAQGTSCSA